MTRSPQDASPHSSYSSRAELQKAQSSHFKADDGASKAPGDPPKSEMLCGGEMKQVREVIVQVLLNAALSSSYYRLDRESKK